MAVLAHPHEVWTALGMGGFLAGLARQSGGLSAQLDLLVKGPSPRGGLLGKGLSPQLGLLSNVCLLGSRWFPCTSSLL